MKLVDLLHRWAGGCLGILLALLGLSGAILLHKHRWISLPHMGDPQVQDVALLSAALNSVITPAQVPRSIIFASEDFGLHRVRFDQKAGAYTDQTGAVVAQWESKWDRPELWLFDLHHYLWAGDTGTIVAGWLALIGLCFVVTGSVLWWRSRRTFKLRLWPARMSRPAIVRHHRDAGIVLSPLLFISLLTGAMLTLRPFANVVLSPWSSANEMRDATAAPKHSGGSFFRSMKWESLLTQARRRFPAAEFRVLTLPKKRGDLIALRMKQPQEWLSNGRTVLWFDPANGRLVEARSSDALPAGSRIFNMVGTTQEMIISLISLVLTFRVL